MSKEIERGCQCSKLKPIACSREMTGEDLLCDDCRVECDRMRLRSCIKKIRKEVSFMLWVLGISGWVKAFRDTRGSSQVSTPDASESNVRGTNDGPEYGHTGLPVEPR